MDGRDNIAGIRHGVGVVLGRADFATFQESNLFLYAPGIVWTVQVPLNRRNFAGLPLAAGTGSGAPRHGQLERKLLSLPFCLGERPALQANSRAGFGSRRCGQ